MSIEDLAHHQEPHVTVAELAEYFRVSEKTIRRDIDRGNLEVMRLPGGTIRIPTKSARAYGRPTGLHPLKRTNSGTPE